MFMLTKHHDELMAIQKAAYDQAQRDLVLAFQTSLTTLVNALAVKSVGYVPNGLPIEQPMSVADADAKAAGLARKTQTTGGYIKQERES